MSPGESFPQEVIEEIRNKIWYRFSGVAVAQVSPFPIGPESAKAVGYPEELVDSFPTEVTEAFAGVGNPFSLGPIKPGETVLDVGCGSGLDALIAARLVGPTGSVVGFDMVPEMVEKARQNVEAQGAKQVLVFRGLAENLPLADELCDVVISNGVINLLPEKRPLLLEIHRVLKPGGRFMVADMLLLKPLPPEALQDPDLWSQ
ncbi:MAG: methyltransferase domain-containing protein [Nitrospinae bacterium]|nr:methyltransferase domain-containing protein [Nitrospinota bacterium]